MRRGLRWSVCGAWLLTACPSFTTTSADTDTDADGASSMDEPTEGPTADPTAATDSASETTASATEPSATQSEGDASETNPSDSDPSDSDPSDSDPSDSDPSDSDPSDTDPSDSDPSDSDPSDSDPSDSDPSDSDPSDSDPSDTDPSDSDTNDSDTDDCQQLDVEPNDGEKDDEFVELGVAPCDGPPIAADGTILDDVDLDIFAYDNVWDCTADTPVHTVNIVSGDVLACVFPVCSFGMTANVECVQGTPIEGKSVEGCCSEQQVRAIANCSNKNDFQDSFAFVAFENDEAVCEDYTFTYAVLAAP